MLCASLGRQFELVHLVLGPAGKRLALVESARFLPRKAPPPAPRRLRRRGAVRRTFAGRVGHKRRVQLEWGKEKSVGKQDMCVTVSRHTDTG